MEISNAMDNTEVGSLHVQGEIDNGNSLKAEEIRPDGPANASPTANEKEPREKLDLTGAAVADPTTTGASALATSASELDGASEKVEDIGKVRGFRDGSLALEVYELLVKRHNASLPLIYQEISNCMQVL